MGYLVTATVKMYVSDEDAQSRSDADSEALNRLMGQFGIDDVEITDIQEDVDDPA